MYLSAGLPVISAFQGDLKEIIESEQVGYYFEPGDADGLMNAILKLHNNPRIYEELSRKAISVFDSGFEEKKVYGDFADYVEMIARKSMG